MERVWREFFLNLLSYFAEGKQDVFYDKLMRYLIQPKFNIKEFRGFLTEPAMEGSCRISSVKEQLNQTANKEEKPLSTQQEFSSNTGKTLGGLSIFGLKGKAESESITEEKKLSFSIPGKSGSINASNLEIKKTQTENKIKQEKEIKKETEAEQEICLLYTSDAADD